MFEPRLEILVARARAINASYGHPGEARAQAAPALDTMAMFVVGLRDHVRRAVGGRPRRESHHHV